MTFQFNFYVIMSVMDNSQKLKEIAQKIKAISKDAIAKIKELEKEQKEIVKNYTKSLEQKKIEAIRKEILNKG